MSDRRLGFAMAFIIPLIVMILGPFSVMDLAGWIAHGRYFLEHHEVLRADVFSVLPTAPLVYPAFGISVIYALIDRAAGLTAVCLFHSLLLAGLLWIIYRHSLFTLENPASRVARASLYVFWLGAFAAFGERPSMVALLPFVAAFVIIDSISHSSEISPKQILKLCALNILWVNIHGSFVLLWLMFGWKVKFLTLAEWKNPGRGVRIVRAAIAHLCIGLSALINPFGYRVYPYVVETALKSRQRYISEWEATTPWAHFPTGILYYCLCAAVIFFVWRSWRKSGFGKMISSPFFPVLLVGASAIRNAALPFVVLLPALKSAGFLDARQKPRRDPDLARASNFAPLFIFCGIALLVLPVFKPYIAGVLPPSRRDIFDNSAVFEIAKAIRESRATCPIYNSWETGGFLMANLPNKIFIDGRNIIYSDEIFWEYARAAHAHPGWEAYLGRYGACFAVLDPAWDSPLIAALRGDSGWKYVAQEKSSVLFERRSF